MSIIKQYNSKIDKNLSNNYNKIICSIHLSLNFTYVRKIVHLIQQ
jgi:hypothetical protein